MATQHTTPNVWNTGMAKFFNGPDLTDFKIVCGEAQWNVHRLALSVQSKVLGRACSGPFKESKQRTLDLSEHECMHVKAMLEYIYKCYYDVPPECSRAQKLCFHIDMCVLGDKYDIKGLRKLSVKNFKSLFDSTLSQADVASVTSHAYDSAGAAIIRRKLSAGIVKLGHFSYYTENKELEEVMERYPELAIEVARAMSDLQNWTRPKSPRLAQLTCNHCKFRWEWCLSQCQSINVDCPRCKRADTFENDLWFFEEVEFSDADGDDDDEDVVSW